MNLLKFPSVNVCKGIFSEDYIKKLGRVVNSVLEILREICATKTVL
jgi:hypothetical protein